jgi:hypothetical protein
VLTRILAPEDFGAFALAMFFWSVPPTCGGYCGLGVNAREPKEGRFIYAKGLLSFGKARQLAGMTRWDFHELLGEEGILRRYDVEELEEDLQTLEELG